jgi:hypothetical protein
VSGSYLLNPWDEFHETLVKCSPHQDNMQNSCSNLAGSRSRSPVVFEDLNNVFCPSICANFVWSITTQPLEGISWNFSQMFSPWRWCAEPMFQPCWLKVKVTSDVWRFGPCISCPVHIYWTPGMNIMKLLSNVQSIKMMCRIHVPTWLAQGQCH